MHLKTMRQSRHLFLTANAYQVARHVKRICVAIAFENIYCLKEIRLYCLGLWLDFEDGCWLVGCLNLLVSISDGC